jgi:hypothetical protein
MVENLQHLELNPDTVLGVLSVSLITLCISKNLKSCSIYPAIGQLYGNSFKQYEHSAIVACRLESFS